MKNPFNMFATKAAPERSPSEAPVQAEVIYLNSGIAIGIVTWSEAIAVEQAMRHPVVYRALDKIALSVQQCRWYVEEDPNAPSSERANKARVISDIQSLLDSPNGELTPAMLRYWLALNYASYGRAPLKIGFKATQQDRPNGIYPLEAKQVLAKMNDRAVAQSYEYGTGENKQTYRSRATAALGEAFVDQIWKPGLKGYQDRKDINNPLQAIGLPAQVIKSLLLRAIQTAEGHPNVRYLVTCSKTLTDAQKKALKDHLNKDHGPDGPSAGGVPILQNAADVVIHTLDNDLSDIHSKMPSDDMARLIFGAFGIPIALAGMGAADGAKFAGNYIESRQAFWQDTIIPAYIDPIFQGMTRMICPPGLRISADYDSIPALLDGRVLSMAKAKDIDFLTIPEKRELFGWPKEGGPTPAVVKPTTPTPTENPDGA